MDYLDFLKGKAPSIQHSGFAVSDADVHPILKPHQRDIVRWACKGGRRALFESFGLGKSVQQIEIVRLCMAQAQGLGLIICPLGVRQEFKRDAQMLGVQTRFIRRADEIDPDFTGVYLTNYESVRDGKLDPNLFTAVSLDEAAVLRSFGSKTYQTFLSLFDSVRYRFVATATPDPNRYKELIHYAGFLGVMDTGQALTRWFQRDSTQANNLTLYPHKEGEFWAWVHSWAIFLQRPSDLGYSDEGYDLPELRVHYHEVSVDLSSDQVDRDGQGSLFRDAALGLGDAAREKRDGMPARIEKMLEILAENPERHAILWHDLEDERHAISKAVPECVEVYGSLDMDERERRVIDFSEGRIKYLATKPVVSGTGCNFQRHCSMAVFVGIGHKFHDLIQAIHRIQRFQQPEACDIHIIYTETEREILSSLRAKWARHNEQVANMSTIIREHGLDSLSMADIIKRSIGIERIEVSGEGWSVANNDCVEEAKRMADNSIDLLITSIPFANHYEYTPSYNDFGHTADNAAFWNQMDFLTPEIYRVMKPGRIVCIHVKDRINFGNVTGAGIPTVSPFHFETLAHYSGIPSFGIKGHGFDYLGMITVVTDVVRENNQTYRLGWSEQCKDGTKMGVGSPEYILIFHKPQSDRGKGYADEPVKKDKPRCLTKEGEIVPFDRELMPIPGEGYSRSRWQVDAHAFWRSSGNRLLTTEELCQLGPDQLAKVFTEHTLKQIYDYESHVRIGEELDARGALPSQFMSLAPGSHDPNVWHDVNRMLTLNGQQSARGLAMHVCLARGSLVLTRERGYVPIETVQVGEQTLTHKGRWRRVMVARATGTRPTIKVNAQGVPGLTLTPDHKVWARKTEWVRSRDGAERAEPEWIEAQHTLGGYLNFKLPECEPASGDAQFWWIVGRWLADGHWETRGGVSISCGDDKRAHLAASLGPLAGAWRDTGTSHQVHVIDRSGILRDVLSDCGAGASGKHLPAIAYSLPREQAEALLIGYLSGDGHYARSRGTWMATSVSRALALGIAMLAQRVFGAIASVRAGRPPRQTLIEGRAVNCKQEWIVSFDSGEGLRKRPFILEDGAWKKVRSLEMGEETEVWCLRVEEDESFTAEGCIVKNCPLQIDIVKRLIGRYSNEGDLVYDPFGGLMTVPYCALGMKRRGTASELNAGYFLDGVKYLEAKEREMSMPDLFDTLEAA